MQQKIDVMIKEVTSDRLFFIFYNTLTDLQATWFFSVLATIYYHIPMKNE